jgi:hypothetical protein
MQKLLTLGIACVLLYGTANAATIEFTQEGWQKGAILNVRLSGEDINRDGELGLSELSSFNANWGIPGGIVTAWTLPNIPSDGFFFSNLDNYVFLLENTNFTLVKHSF